MVRLSSGSAILLVLVCGGSILFSFINVSIFIICNFHLRRRGRLSCLVSSFYTNKWLIGAILKLLPIKYIIALLCVDLFGCHVMGKLLVHNVVLLSGHNLWCILYELGRFLLLKYQISVWAPPKGAYLIIPWVYGWVCLIVPLQLVCFICLVIQVLKKVIFVKYRFCSGGLIMCKYNCINYRR